jgi:transglutaminase-like putative cysteine protease
MYIRRHSILAFLAALLLTSSRAGAQEQVYSGPPADWVAPLSVDRAAAQAPAQPGETVRWLVKDRQINEQVDQSYGHESLQILTSAGVQNASQIAVDFDPSCEILTFHWVRILRGATVIERFDRDKVRVLQRETDLENFLFSGIQTAVLMVDDVRRGDILDYAYTITGTNPSLHGRWFGRVPVQLEDAVGRLRTRLLWPAERRLYTKNYLTDARPLLGRKGDLMEFIWDFKNVPGLPVEDHLPAWYDPFPSVQLSEYHQWSEVNQWALGLFTNAAPLSTALLSQINEWRGLKDHAAETLAALQFIQDEIRYLGLESGPNAYTPAPPGTVFDRRFGDCKDKTLLLVTVLRALGIPAFPVLVNTIAHQTIAERQPSSTDFDHAIVQATVDGQVYWLDPTATYQRGPLSDHYYPDYGYGLVVRPGASALTPIPLSGGRPLTTVNEYFHMGRPPGASTLKIVTVGEGADAVALRERYATTARDQIERQDLNFFAKLYPQISQTDPSVFLDDEAANRVEIDEFYRLDGDWTPPPPNIGGWWTFRVYSHNVDAAVRRPGSPIRTMPLGLSYPRHEIFRMETVPPVMYYNGNDDQTVRNPAFYFHRSVNVRGQTLALEYEYNALADFAPVEGMSEYARQLEQASDLLDFTIESYPEQQ